MPERDEKEPSERPDYLSDFPEEFAQHPDAPPRDLARRERAQTDRVAAETRNQSRDPIVPRSEPKASGDIHEARARTGSQPRSPIVPRSEPKASGETQNSALARIEAMKKRVRELHANQDDPD